MKIIINENCGEGREDMIDHRSYTQLYWAVVKLKLKKIQAWTGFEHTTFAIPMQFSTNWATKHTGSWLRYELRT